MSLAPPNTGRDPGGVGPVLPPPLDIGQAAGPAGWSGAGVSPLASSGGSPFAGSVAPWSPQPAGAGVSALTLASRSQDHGTRLLPGFPTPPCPPAAGRIQKPDYASLDVATQDCMDRAFGGGGVLTEWPAEDCCAPFVTPRPNTDCSFRRVPDMRMEFFTTASTPPDYVGVLNPPFAIQDDTGIPNMRLLYGAGVALLQDNIDLVRWATCLAETYSTRLLRAVPTSGPVLPCLEQLIFGTGVESYPTIIGQFAERVVSRPAGGGGGPWQRVVTRRRSQTGGSAWGFERPRRDGSVGVILPMDQLWWAPRLEMHAAGTDCERLCAVVGAAATILHEMAHICTGDLGYHQWKDLTDAEDAVRGFQCAMRSPASSKSFLTCGEPTLMISSAFWWALTKRMPGVLGPACCVRFGLDSRFLISDCDGRSWGLC